MISVDDKLVDLRRKEEEELAQVLAKKHGITYLDLSRITVDLMALKIIPEAEARSNSMAIIQSVGRKLQIAVTNPDRPGVIQILDELARKKFEVQLFMVSPTSLEKAFAKYKEIPRFEEIKVGIVDISKAKLELYGATLDSLASFKEAMSKAKEKDVRKASDTLELLLAGTLGAEASDIHMEAEEKIAKIRLRIDGVLQDIVDIPTPLYQLLLSRIKLVSELKLNIHDKAQGGRFSLHTNIGEIEVRSSTLPGPYGESVVLRVLNPKTIGMKLEDLGIQPETLEIIMEEIKKPNGMILTTGPTGSGKTTTLYAFLKKIYSSEMKIITIEDPIEYHIAGISQTQVNQSQKYTFINGLKSILRQDPDVIMVGEIRDKETAEAAIHAALTGHLVFSTLHAKNSAGTILRLIDLGIKPNLISPSINLAIAQRLVRKLCPKSKIKDKPTPKEMKIIQEIIKTFPKKIKKPGLESLSVWRAKPCILCNNTGYKGRIGIFEAFLMNKEIEKIILRNPNEADIQKIADEQNILNIRQDGILKILEGITSFEEVSRVIELRA